jgi:hypothetical protein
MIMRKVFFTLIVSATLILGANTSFGHGGGLDSQGGHNCRVGSCAGTYHCHQAWGPGCGGGTKPSVQRKTILTKCVDEQAEELTSSNMAFIQTKLKTKGFDPGAIDGSYGAGTKKALNAFEKKYKLTQSMGSSINNASMEKLGVNC